jgi:hypothetical protein
VDGEQFAGDFLLFEILNLNLTISPFCSRHNQMTACSGSSSCWKARGRRCHPAQESRQGALSGQRSQRPQDRCDLGA